MVSFSTAIRNCFKKYAKFKGRAMRSEYWWCNYLQVLQSGWRLVVPVFQSGWSLVVPVSILN